MADIDIDPFGEHESRPEEPTDENIPLDPVTPGREGVQTWEPTTLKIYIKSYQKTLVKPQNYFTMIILNSKMGAVLQRQ